jgi:hypothetical protein
MAATIKTFHASFPNGKLNPNIDPTPPPSLATLRAQIDSITLQYRDRLRNALPETTFQSLQTTVRQKFAPGSVGNAPSVPSNKTGAIQ